MIIPALAILSGFAAVFVGSRLLARMERYQRDLNGLDWLPTAHGPQYADQGAEQRRSEFRGVVGVLHGEGL